MYDVTTLVVASLSHWEVYSEQEQNKWYEAQTGDADAIQLMFEEVTSRARDTTLMLNDYNVVANNGISTQVTSSSLCRQAHMSFYQYHVFFVALTLQYKLLVHAIKCIITMASFWCIDEQVWTTVVAGSVKLCCVSAGVRRGATRYRRPESHQRLSGHRCNTGACQSIVV